MDAGTFIVWILGICVVYRLLNKLLDVIKTKKEEPKTRTQKYKDICEFWDEENEKEGKL